MNTIVTFTPDVAGDRDPLTVLAAPPREASMIEVRLDLFPGLDPATVVRACPVPTLLTVRSGAEGGGGPDDPARRRELLRSARDAAPAMLDLEFERDHWLVSDLGLAPEQVVLSWHDIHGTPQNLADRVRRMAASPVQFLKLVPTVGSTADLTVVLTAMKDANSKSPGRRRAIVFGMGLIGVASRYLAPLIGPPVMYCAWSDDRPAASGQISCTRLLSAIGHLQGQPRAVDVVIGGDVGRSLSPSLHGAAHAVAGHWDVLLPLSVTDPDETEALLCGRQATPFSAIGLEVRGWAVTTPYKQLAAASADVMAPRVQRAGAANTLFRRGGRLIAENTDADGVVGGLKSIDIDVEGLSALVAGTGGAARGAAVGLDQAGADVILRGRDGDTARSVAETLRVGSCDPEDRAGAEILVNATPLGTRSDDPSPFTEDEVIMATAVVDMVYGTGPTPLERLCTKAGVPFVSGRRMLAHQGMAQFSAFTQTPPPRRAMLAAVGISESRRRPGPVPSVER